MLTKPEKNLKLNYRTVMHYIKALPLLIRDGGVSHKELERMFDRSRTTILGFEATLEALHGTRLNRLKNGNLKLDPEDDLWLKNSFKPIVLEWSERLVLDLILSIDLPYLPGEIRQAKKELLAKLALFDEDSQGPERIIADAAKMFSLSNLGRVDADLNLPFFQNPDILDDLLSAIDSTQVCLVSYRNRHGDEPKNFRIKPLRLFEKMGAPYFLVQAGDEDFFRCLRPAGIMSLEWTRDSFEPIDAELIDTHIDSAFGTYYGDMQQVAVRFDAEIIPFIQERNWHDSQKFSLPEADGSVVMTFSASGLVDIMRWVMSYGSHAQALEPPALVSAIREEISRMGKAYC